MKKRFDFVVVVVPLGCWRGLCVQVRLAADTVFSKLTVERALNGWQVRVTPLGESNIFYSVFLRINVESKGYSIVKDGWL